MVLTRVRFWRFSLPTNQLVDCLRVIRRGFNLQPLQSVALPLPPSPFPLPAFRFPLTTYPSPSPELPHFRLAE